MKELIGQIGILFMLAGIVPYAIALWQRKIKPHAFSWLLWGLINAVIFGAQLSEGAGHGAWPTAVSMIGTSLIGLYALKWGERNYTRSDWVFLILALMALPLWAATHDPLWSVLLVSAIDIMAFIPTIRKSWHRPHEENALSFGLGALGFLCSLLAIDHYILTNYLYPALVMTGNTFFVIMLLIRRKI